MKNTILSLVCMLIASYTFATTPLVVDNFETKSGKNLEICFLGHSSLVMTFDGKVIHIDPVSEFADYTTLPKADLILITHEHSDHLDKKAIDEIEKQGTVIVANASSAKILGKGKVMNNGDVTTPVKWLSLEATPAYNTTEGREIFHPNNGRDNGYVITIGGSRIYIAGDTEDIPQLKNLKDIDVAFLPVNQPYTMTPEQAVRAAEMFSPKILYPYHYGDTDIMQVVDGLKHNSAIEVRIRDMK